MEVRNSTTPNSDLWQYTTAMLETLSRPPSSYGLSQEAVDGARVRPGLGLCGPRSMSCPELTLVYRWTGFTWRKQMRSSLREYLQKLRSLCFLSVSMNSRRRPIAWVGQWTLQTFGRLSDENGFMSHMPQAMSLFRYLADNGHEIDLTEPVADALEKFVKSMQGIQWRDGARSNGGPCSSVCGPRAGSRTVPY